MPSGGGKGGRGKREGERGGGEYERIMVRHDRVIVRVMVTEAKEARKRGGEGESMRV